MTRLVLAFVGRAIDRAFAPRGWQFKSASWSPTDTAPAGSPPVLGRRGCPRRF